MSIGHPLSRTRGLSGAAAKTAPTQLELTGGPSQYAPSEHPAARAERERIFAILNHPHAAAQPDTARELALTPCLSPQAAATILAGGGRHRNPDAPAGQTFATRAAELWDKYGKNRAETGAEEPSALAPVAQPIQPASERFTERARGLWDRYGKNQGAAIDPLHDDG
ncbi:hypothetical protein [Paraburkholderia sp. MM5384-R2]|uniref:hypothetical protein n=1 Tax=Paraburkholderia sp. MM5384-R2 TaxID=2723097 RepID=UPI00160BAB2C|nr:hypothetical protein [Paraburkholderia sp. MM5384-R2]MBB5501560.1 hypothetical protein [Paraburkholderia sp. MM5384-R2]